MLDYEDLGRRADALRGDLGIPSGPVSDVFSVLREAGLKVVLKRLGQRGPDGMYVRRRNLGFVLLNSSKYLPRLRFTAAHELAHHILGHQVAVDQDVEKTGGDPQEKAANSFAASFLVPRADLRERAQGARIDPPWILSAATEFGVSYGTLVYRLHNSGALPGGYQERDELLASRIAVVPASLDMSAAPDGTVLPTEYVRRAIGAYLQGAITQERLAELIEADPEQLDRLFAAGGTAEHGDETP